MAGFSSVTGQEAIVFADNASFDGTQRGGAMTTNGQLFIGSTALPHINKGFLTSPLGTITIGYSSPNITIDLTGGGEAIGTFSPNSGTNPVGPNSNGLVNMKGTGSVTTIGSLNTLTFELTGLTNHAVQVGAGTATLTQVGPSATTGAVLASNGAAADPSFQTISSLGVVTTVTGNSGGGEVPLSGNFNILGTGSITVAGSANTETVQLTGLTNHAVLVGAGTATITNISPTANTGAVLQNNSGADPSYSTATYPSTTTINQILYSSAANTVTGLATANNGVLTTGTSGIPVTTPLTANGQIIIGSGAGAPIAATISQGTGITVTNASNSITIAATGGSFAWVDVTTATQALSVQTGYVTDHVNVAYTLPATAVLGDQIRIVGKLGSWSIAQNAGQQILVSSASSTAGVTGSVASTNVGDCMWLVCVTAGASTIWRAESFVGNLTVS